MAAIKHLNKQQGRCSLFKCWSARIKIGFQLQSESSLYNITMYYG